MYLLSASFREIDAALSGKELFFADLLHDLPAIDRMQLILLHDHQIAVGDHPEHIIIGQAQLPDERSNLT